MPPFERNTRRDISARSQLNIVLAIDALGVTTYRLALGRDSDAHTSFVLGDFIAYSDAVDGRPGPVLFEIDIERADDDERVGPKIFTRGNPILIAGPAEAPPRLLTPLVVTNLRLRIDRDYGFLPPKALLRDVLLDRAPLVRPGKDGGAA